MEDNKKEEEGEATSHQVFLREWEQIQSPPTSLLQSQIRWEILDNPHNDFSIFPPSNHEGLHISPPLLQQKQQQNHYLGNVDGDSSDGVNGDDVEVKEKNPDVPQRVSSSLCGAGSRRALLDSRFQVLGDVLMKRLRLGFEVLRSKLFWVASLVRSRIGPNWAAIGVTTAAFLTTLWYLWWWRLRQRLRREKRDRLILILQEQNERISQLLDQITRLNEILSTRRRVSVLGSS